MGYWSQRFWDSGFSTRSPNATERGVNEAPHKTVLRTPKCLCRSGLQEEIYSTTAILLAMESGIHRRPLASRAILRTEELVAGIG